MVFAPFCPLRRLRRHLSQRERLFLSPIITQIGRENKFSAEILVPVISPLRMQREKASSFCLLQIWVCRSVWGEAVLQITQWGRGPMWLIKMILGISFL